MLEEGLDPVRVAARVLYYNVYTVCVYIYIYIYICVCIVCVLIYSI